MKTALSNLTRILLLATLLAAFALRASTLDLQSFWSDEGISLLRSSAPFGEMLRQMPVEHMPGYFVLLHFWLQLTESHDFGIRYLSLWPSVLAVALLFQLALSLAIRGDVESEPDSLEDRRFGIAVGLGSAVLLATAAFQVWYAQEARMYSWLLASGLAAHLFLWRIIRTKGQAPTRLFFGYIVATALSVYLHFYGFLVPIAHITYMVGWSLATRQWRTFGKWVACGLLVLLLFVPWLPKALGIFEFSGWRSGGDPSQIPQQYFSAYTVGDALTQPWRTWLIGAYIALSIVGIVGWLRHRLSAGLFILNAILVPMAAVIGFALSNPDFHERYAIIVSGAIPLTVAGAIAFTKTAGRFGWALPVALTAALLAGNGLSLTNQNSDSAFHKPDFRGAAYRIAINEKPGDVILVDGPDPEKVFLHYYKGAASVHDLRSLEGQPWETVSDELVNRTQGASRIWELLYFHGPGPVQMWTATNAWATDPSYHNNIRVTLYGTKNDLFQQQASNEPLNIDFGSGLRLLSAEVNGESFAIGDLVRVSTNWQVDEALPDYKFSLRLLTMDGAVIRSWDYIPQNWIAPTTMWVVGSQATDQHGFLIDPGIQPASYKIAIRLYDPTNGIAAKTAVGQDVVLRTIAIKEATAAEATAPIASGAAPPPQESAAEELSVARALDQPAETGAGK